MKRKRSRSAEKAGRRCLLRISTDEGATFEFSVPAGVALGLAWQILAASTTAQPSSEVAGG